MARKKAPKPSGDGPISLRFSAGELGIPGTSAVEVGYKEPYAVFVHENIRTKHTNGQAKFLSAPAQQLRGAMARQAQQTLDGGGSRRDALLDAGELLLSVSQAYVPVDTGALKRSGYVRIRR